MDVHNWRSAVAFDAEAMAGLLRESLDALGYEYVRETAERGFEETVLVLALPKRTVAHRFRVTSPGRFTVDAFDTRPTPGALLPYVEVLGVLREEHEAVRRLLAEVVRRAPRPPWQFTWGQRLAVGLLHPAFRGAKRAWAGVASGR